MAAEIRDLVMHTDKVVEFLDESELLLKHKESYFRKRALLELKYSQDLAKLHTSYQSTLKPEDRVNVMGLSAQELADAGGSLTVGFYNILEHDEHACMLHEEHALLLNATIVEPLAHIIELYEQRSKQVKSDMHYQQKQIDTISLTLRREKQTFMNAKTDLADVEELMGDKNKKKDKEWTKLLLRRKKATDAIEESRLKMEQLQKDDQDTREMMHRDMPDLLEEVQMLEGWKNRGVKDMYRELSNILLNQIQRIGQSALMLSNVLDATNVDTDTVRFLSEATQERKLTNVTTGWEMANSSACSMSGRMHMNNKGVVGAVRWKRCFFALLPRERLLYYYDDEESKPKYAIPIGEGDRIVRPCDMSLFQKDLVFQLITDQGPIYMSCANEDEMSKWMLELRKVTMGDEADLTNTVREVQSLRANVMEAKDVAVGSYFCMVVLDWEYQARTQTKAQASAPFWGEKFTFSNFPSSLKTLMVVIYQNERTFTGGSKEVPVGKVSISVDTLAKTESFTQWCSIEDMKSNNFINGSLRLELQYSHEVVRPTEDYTELVNCLSYPDVLRCLNVMIPPKQRERTAKHMLKIYRARGEADRLVSSLCQIEIASTDNPNILFRGNSLATKAVDQYTKLVAMAYLHQVLTPIITQIYNCTESCEVDPTRLNNNQTQMAENWKRLLGFTEQVWMAVVTAVDKCPYELRSVMKELQKDAEGHFQEEENIRYTVIAGVFFLRFIVPAILNPKLFNMMPGHPSDTVGRTLMLVAKTIQNLSNLVLFGAKEPYMNPMNVFIESNLEAMKNVIDRLCWTRENEELSPPPVIDEGIEMAMLYRVLVNIGRGLVNYQEENKGEDIEPLLVALGEIKNLMFHG